MQQHRIDPIAARPDAAAALEATITDGGAERLPVHTPAEAGLVAPPTLGDPGRYHVVRLLGAGGMGVVFEAHDLVLDRTVALKVVRAVDGADVAQARLCLEARAMAKLTHPNVVTIFDVGTVGDRVFIAMELVRGGTLRGLVGADRPWRELVRILAQAGRGLAAAHAAGVVHRDFKPDNVLVGADGTARVADFGLACIGGPAGGAPAPGHRPGAVAGTLAYMAPERLAGDATACSDQFAFCVTAFELLEGYRPFDVVADEASTPERLRALLEHRRLPWARPDVPARIRAIFDRGMRPDAEERWPDLDALLAALAAALDDAQAPRAEHRGGCRTSTRTRTAERTRPCCADQRVARPAARTRRAVLVA
jgi:serine/threonine protein kinase